MCSIFFVDKCLSVRYNTHMFRRGEFGKGIPFLTDWLPYLDTAGIAGSVHSHFLLYQPR